MNKIRAKIYRSIKIILKNKVLIFSAPSGSGKTTLVRHSLSQFPLLSFSVSATTRQPRCNEQHMEDYFFLTLDEFHEKISNDEFVEFEEVYINKYYGTLKSEVERIWNEGKIVIFDVDVKGGIRLKKIFREKALSVFVAPPSIEELERRLTSRDTDSVETIKIRIAKAEEEMSYKILFDKVIINADLDEAKAEVEKIIRDFINS